MASELKQGIDWGTEVPGKVVHYTFGNPGEVYLSPLGTVTSEGFVPYEKQQFKLAFKLYSSFLDLKFAEVTQQSAADFNLAAIATDAGLLGAMSPPGYGGSGGYGVFNYLGVGWDYTLPGAGALEQGGFGFITIIHELGHGLGLAHPHDNGGSSSVFPGVSSASDLGTYDLNQGLYTVMTYNDGWQTNPAGDPPALEYGYEGTPMAIDIAVLQKKYGANESYHTGRDVYVLPADNSVGTFYSCLWDAGGKDAIVVAGDLPSLIDLRPATLKVEPGGGGFLSYSDGIFGGFTIAHGVVIENGKGGGGDDFIQGNGHKNRLKGNGGDDTLLGAARKDFLHGGDGGDLLRGGKGNDQLSGEAGDDLLVGGKGSDILNGGTGADMLKGGAESDTFIFNSKIESDKIDSITDFAHGSDLIELSAAVFAGIGALGALAASAFALGAAATDTADRIVYDPGTGALRFDADGTAAVEAVQFAKLQPGLTVSATDFVVIA